MRPAEQVVKLPGVDHALLWDAAPGSPPAAIRLPLELAGSMRIGVNREQAASVDRLSQQPARRVETFRSRVDFDGDAELATSLEDKGSVELGLGAAATHNHPARAVTKYINKRVGNSHNHPPGHRTSIHTELAVHRSNDDIELSQEFWLLVERSIVQDVDLDSREKPERCKLGV